MTMEAMAGKNPVTHVGKLYNALAFRIAGRAVEEQAEITSCECRLMSQIGRPIAEPRLAHLHAATATGRLSPEGEQSLHEIASAEFVGSTSLWREFLASKISVA
jgi:S-adenosylmethionine synthetase